MDGTPLAAAADSAVSVEGLFELLGLVVIVAVVAALGRRVQVAGPILLVLVGFLLSYVPGVPDYRIDPNVVLLLFLRLVTRESWRATVATAVLTSAAFYLIFVELLGVPLEGGSLLQF